MDVPRVLVYEHLTGGGYAARALPPGLAAEGGAMLAAALADFRAWGRVRLVTTVDWRLRGLRLAADEVIPIGPGEYDAALASVMAGCDASLLIAPETGGLLADLSVRAAAAGNRLLGSSPAAIRLAGDKWECHRVCLAAGLRTPAARLVDPAQAAATAEALGYPVVLKPVDGIGCEGVSLIHTPAELDAGIALAGAPLLVQRFVAGVPASVSLLAGSADALPVSLNGQDVTLGTPSTYRGGVVPLDHPAADDARALARSAVRAIPGLRGYVGVDVVLAGDTAWLIEINPRLTTSYVALRQVVQVNLAQAIWEACVNDRLPERVPLLGRVSFDKTSLPGSLEAH